MLPWAHLYVHPTGEVYPCCISDVWKPFGTLRGSTLEEVWNSPEMRGMRRRMLAGEPSPHCERCYGMERVGIESMRRSQNRWLTPHFGTVEETREDGTVPGVRMPYLDIRFSNLCNHRCRTCGPHLSSSWHEDYARLIGPSGHEAVVRPTADPAALWAQVEPLLPGVEHVYFSGGEPLLMDEHYRLLKALLALGRTGTRLSYSTNLSVTRHGGDDALSLWNRFEKVEVYASLDASGARGEYLRKGQVWAEIERTRERMLRQCPRVEFYVKPTLSAMNALHLPDFHRDWLERGFVAPGHWHLTILVSPEEYRLQVLPAPLKSEVAERYRRHLDETLAPYGEAMAVERGLYRGALEFLAEEDRSPLLPRLRDLTRRLDAMRGEDFARTFPELAELSPSPLEGKGRDGGERAAQSSPHPDPPPRRGEGI